MKIYYSIILFATAILMTSCDPDYTVEEYFDLEQLPGYVAFDTGGNNAVMDDFEAAEDGGSLDIVVENPTGTQSDISVSYSLGGSATFGTDYTIAGASASGGSLTIKPNSGAVTETNRESINIELLTDDTADGEKSIIITLTEASNAEGTVAVGRGGTDFLKTATVLIADID